MFFWYVEENFRGVAPWVVRMLTAQEVRFEFHVFQSDFNCLAKKKKKLEIIK